MSLGGICIAYGSVWVMAEFFGVRQIPRRVFEGPDAPLNIGDGGGGWRTMRPTVHGTDPAALPPASRQMFIHRSLPGGIPPPGRGNLKTIRTHMYSVWVCMAQCSVLIGAHTLAE